MEGRPSDRLKTALAGAIGDEEYRRLTEFYHTSKVTFRSMFTGAGRHSAKQLRAWRDRHRGGTCVILGNGPSLKETDWSLLEDVFTFGLNRIYLAFDDVGFRTSVLVSVNRLVLEQSLSEMLVLPIPKFLSWQAKDLFELGPDITLVQPVTGPRFSTNPVLHGIWEGSTVTYVAMQLAYWMGFTRVILIGVDHYFETQGPAHEAVVSEGPDPNHFHPEYFGKGFKWNLPDLQTSEIAYCLAREAFESDGRVILDATVGGALTVFPKMDLKAALRM